MIKNYDTAFSILMQIEGYESNLENDPGGETIFGVSSKFYPDVFKSLKKVSFDKGLFIAKKFYKTEFWDKYMCNNLPPKIDILYFLTAVNTPKGEKVIAFHIGTFENECLELIRYYIRETKSDYKIGLVNRVLKIWECLKCQTENTNANQI